MHPRSRLLRISLLLLLLSAPAGARTLTAQDGRTIEAEVLGFEGLDKVTFKRADTGQVFTLPIATFGEADQRALEAEAKQVAAKAPPLRPGDLMLEFTRTRFETRKSRREVKMGDGTIRKDSIDVTEDDWGYSITLKNNTRRPLENLRIDYILYTRIDVIENIGREARTRAKKFSQKVEPVPPGARLASRTESVTTRKTELRDGMVWSGSGDDTTRDTLTGIWLRIYRDDELVLEASSPDGLSKKETWLED
jgi:hypothetical protein